MNGMASYNHSRLDLSLMPGIWASESDFRRGTRLLEEPGFKFKGGSNCPHVWIPHKVSTLNIFDLFKEETDEDKLEDCGYGGDFHAG